VALARAPETQLVANLPQRRHDLLAPEPDAVHGILRTHLAVVALQCQHRRAAFLQKSGGSMLYISLSMTLKPCFMGRLLAGTVTTTL
jgi:hypothetical protein